MLAMVGRLYPKPEGYYHRAGRGRPRAAAAEQSANGVY